MSIGGGEISLIRYLDGHTMKERGEISLIRYLDGHTMK